MVLGMSKTSIKKQVTSLSDSDAVTSCPTKAANSLVVVTPTAADIQWAIM